MAKFCVGCSESAVCDFCKHFDFNGEAALGENGESYANVYVGNGYCRLHNKPADPGSGCDDFYCRRIADKEANANA